MFFFCCFFSNHRRLGLFCSAAQHVWTLAVMHKDLHLLAFSSGGTYMDLIKSISSWQTSSCSAYTIKRRRKKHPVSAATAKKHQGAKDRRANLILKAKFNPLCQCDPGPCDSWLAVHIKHYLGETIMHSHYGRRSKTARVR